MCVGKRISELRKKQGMTQEQLAELLGTTRQAVSKWESEKSNPDLDYVIHMGKLFHVSMDELLLGVASSDDRETGHEIEIPSTPVASTRSRTVCFMMSSIGLLILLLCPLFATMYRNYVSEYEPSLTDPYWYLGQWPLLGVVIAGILSTVIGMLGLMMPILQKLWVAAAAWKEQ